MCMHADILYKKQLSICCHGTLSLTIAMGSLHHYLNSCGFGELRELNKLQIT